MWELINSNKKKSLFLFLSMGIILILLGFLIGSSFIPEGGGLFGIFIAIFIWLILTIISYFAGGSLILSISKAKEINYEAHPQLFNVVEEMKIASGMTHMPKIYIIAEEAPNAFATGRDQKNSAVAVTAGLLSRLNRNELQGVIAHEISHIINRDILYMTFAGVMLGSIVLISDIFIRGFFRSGSSRRYSSGSSKRGGGQAQLLLLAFAIIFAILGPILARLLYFAISRKREYLADATAVRLTRYPEGLASALEKISQNTSELTVANKVTAPLFIANPLKPNGASLNDLTSTHPPITERIRILRNLSYGVSYKDYQISISKIKGKNINLIPDSVLLKENAVPIKTDGNDLSVSNFDFKRNTGNLIMKINNYSFVDCDCGIKIKLPQEYNEESNFSLLGLPICGLKFQNREQGLP